MVNVSIETTVRTLIDDGEGSVVVLWVSRHLPLKVQINALRMKLGKIKLIQVSGIISNAEYVLDLIKTYRAKYVVAVLPLSFTDRLVELTKNLGVKVLYARMKVIAQLRSLDEAKEYLIESPETRTITTYADGTVKVHEFVRFEVIKEVKLVTEPF